MKREKVELVDMHNHILFGVDDGADSIETSINMLKTAYEDGIKKVLLTPHFHPRRGMAAADDIYDAFEVLQERVNKELPDMELYLGREVYFTSESLDMLENHEELRICGGGNVLIEFSTAASASAVSHAVSNVIMTGFTPIVAHVERYGCTIENKHLIEDLKSMGAYIQINADSVLGENGFSIQRVVKWLLKNELVDIIASDAHDAKSREPKLFKCYQYVAKKYGEEYAYYMMHDLPVRILNED
ncbi:MAG: capsular biosynthesis protein [Eubacteriales bacterium]|nr:capsular biosynthesis protein [Eubacteriales bacterium]